MLIDSKGKIEYFKEPINFNLIGNLKSLFKEDYPIDNTVQSTHFVPHVEATWKEKEGLFEYLD